jgi:hypothetical protein
VCDNRVTPGNTASRVTQVKEEAIIEAVAQHGGDKLCRCRPRRVQTEEVGMGRRPGSKSVP